MSDTAVFLQPSVVPKSWLWSATPDLLAAGLTVLVTFPELIGVGTVANFRYRAGAWQYQRSSTNWAEAAQWLPGLQAVLEDPLRADNAMGYLQIFSAAAPETDAHYSWPEMTPATLQAVTEHVLRGLMSAPGSIPDSFTVDTATLLGGVQPPERTALERTLQDLEDLISHQVQYSQDGVHITFQSTAGDAGVELEIGK